MINFTFVIGQIRALGAFDFSRTKFLSNNFSTLSFKLSLAYSDRLESVYTRLIR